MLEELSNWLSQTELSAFLADTSKLSTWLIVPMSQTIHILGVAVVMFSVAIINLKILGIGNRNRSFAQTTGELMPWIWGSLIVLFFTGVIQTIAEPGRELLNIGFKVKMVLLLIVVTITYVYQKTTKNNHNYWESSPERQQTARRLAMMSLFLWTSIAAAGRLIAYLDMRLES